jgi:hypothetical protein
MFLTASKTFWPTCRTHTTVPSAGLRVGNESPSQFRREYGRSFSVHVTSPGGLPREAAAGMDACDEAWRKAHAGELARPQ